MIKIKEYLLHTFIASLLSSESVVIDLGANEGEFSNYIVKNFSAEVFVIEPIPELFNKISSTSLIKKFNYCINGTGKPCKLYIESGMCATTYQKDNAEIIETEGRTIKEFIEEINVDRVDLLKVDIEGAEIEMFESISDKTLNKISQITVEFHDFLWPELKERVERIKNKIIGADFYCIPFSITNNGNILFIKRDLISKFSYLYMKYFLRYIEGIKRKMKKTLL